MIEFKIDRTAFKFQYLADYATYLLENQLREFVVVGIRFSREADLPLLKPLSKYTEAQLVELSMASNQRLLEALSKNTIADHIAKSAQNWIDNTIGVLEREDIAAEDLTLLFYIRRKTFAHFLDAYTKNVVLQKFIIAEVDLCTSREELVSYNIYLKMQQEKLALQRELLFEAQELSGTGSFSINFIDHSKSIYTPEYNRIFELGELTTFPQFLEWVHEEDRPALRSQIEQAYRSGGKYEVEYRYKKTGKEKRIWSKGFIVSDQGRPVLIRGIVREISAKI